MHGHTQLLRMKFHQILPEPLRVYIANESDLVLEFTTDKERYILQYDQDNNPIPIDVTF